MLSREGKFRESGANIILDAGDSNTGDIFSSTNLSNGKTTYV